MLGFIGKWASSKGMGIIPNLEGLSINEARTAIANAGFNLGNETSLGNGGGATSTNNGKAKGRIDSGQLLAYESVLDFEYYSYVQVTTTTQAPTTTQPPVTTSPPVTDPPPPPVTTTTTTSPVVTTTTTSTSTTTTTSAPTLYYGYCALNGSPVGPLATTATCAQAYAAQENANGYPPIGWVCGPTPADGTPSCSTVTTTTTTTAGQSTYYASGCCDGSPVYGSSNVSAANALDAMDGFCQQSQVGVTNRSTSTTGYPAVNCTQPTTTTTTTQAATTTTTTTIATTINTNPNWVVSSNEYRAACCASVTIYLDNNPNSPTYNTLSHRNCLSTGGSQCASTTTTTTTVAPTTTTTTVAATTTTVSTNPNWVASYSEYSGACCATVTWYQDTNTNSPSYGTYSHRNCLSAGGSQCAPAGGGGGGGGGGSTATTVATNAPTDAPTDAPTCTVGGDCGSYTNESTCQYYVYEYNASCQCVFVGAYSGC